MPGRKSEQEDDAPPSHSFTTLTKANHNDGAGNADPDAEGTESESESNVEKEFEKSTGEKLNYNGYYKYRVIK